MSTNHNRIKVADLEKNQPDKILKTNQNGELEFSDVNNLKTEGYNGLDYTAEGKILDARQGKVLKDMIDTINVPQVSLINDLTTGGSSEALTAEMGKTLENQIKALNLDTILKGGNTSQKSIELQYYDSNGSYFSTSSIYPSGFYNEYKDHSIQIINGLIKITEKATGKITTLKKGGLSLSTVEWPQRLTNFNLPLDKPRADYTFATTDDIPEKTPDATMVVKGIIKLAGDLEGTADIPTVKGLNEKLTGTIATDTETQFTEAVPEDNKVVSRSKLYNWWEWQKTKNQTFKGFIGITGGGITVLPYSGTFPYISTYNDAIISWKSATENITIDAANSRISFQKGASALLLSAEAFTASRNILLPNKDGILAIKDDFLKTPPGTATTPALIIPSGTLTTTPQNGAIERDSNGKLWNTISGIRTELVTTRFPKNIGGFINSMSYFFNKPGSLQNDIIEFYNSSAGSSKIYPSNFNSRDDMFIGDIIDSELIMNVGGSAKSLTLRFETWRTASNGANPILHNTFNYTWDASSMPNISVRVIYTRTNSNMSSYGNLGNYIFLINNIYQGTASNIYDYGNNDLRIKLINNTPGINNAYVFPIKATNQFIPVY